MSLPHGFKIAHARLGTARRALAGKRPDLQRAAKALKSARVWMDFAIAILRDELEPSRRKKRRKG